ncbi:hypothetical protein [Mammaliicoccus sciuri]|uniref:hypothetical protein n=1 Tax=Mammaliicoccus sciuri TaxID=1296 RepID=UPI003F56BA62
MENIINLRDQLEKEINQEVEFQFENALRECEMLGELRNFEPERISVPVSSDDDYSRLLFRDISTAINYEIKRRFKEKVDNYINNSGVNLK